LNGLIISRSLDGVREKRESKGKTVFSRTFQEEKCDLPHRGGGPNFCSHGKREKRRCGKD